MELINQSRHCEGAKRPRQSQAGFSTVEILLSFMILFLLLTAVIGVVFGSQSLAVDSQTNVEGQTLAQKILENARALSRSNFLGLNTTATTTETLSNLTFNKKTKVLDISECSKQVDGHVSWWESDSRPQFISVSTIFTSIAEALDSGGDCEPTLLGGDNPSSYPFSDPIFSGSLATDVDVIKRDGNRFALVTTLHNPNPAGHELWMVDVTDIDLNPIPFSGVHTDDDLFAVDAIADYAFVAGATTTAQGPFQVFDITDETNVTLAANVRLPNTIAADFDEARSIYFYQDKVYVGTNYMAFGSPTHDELHIYDVSTPATPVWEASINVDRNVNDIVVRDGKAYLATGPGGDNTVMKIYDVDPSSSTYLDLLGEYTAPTAQEGTAIYILGDYLYLGRDRPIGSGTTQDLFVVINISDSTNPTVEDVTDLMISKGTYVAGVRVTGGKAYIVTSDQNGNNQSGNMGDGPFIVYEVSDPSDIKLITFCGDPNYINWAEKASGLDLADGMGFVSNESGDALRVIVFTNSCP